MFNPIFRKLFWKEFRTLWPLWLAMVVLCMLIDLNVAYFGYGGTNSTAGRHFRIFFTAAILPALYGLGCAGTQFAWELDTGTFRRLRALPLSSGKVVWAKLTWTILSTLLLTATLLGASYLWTGGKSVDGEKALKLFNVYGLATCEAIAWGAIFSMRSCSPILATVKAGTIGVLVFLILTTSYALITGMKIGGQQLTWELYQAVWPYRLGILVLLVTTVVIRGRGWFDYWRHRESQDKNAALSTSKSKASREFSNGSGGFLALCQLHWRQNRKLWGMIVLIVPVLIATLLLNPVFMPDSGWNEIVAAAIFLGSVPIALSVFGADHRTGFQFFANLGLTAKKVWFSRVLISGLFFSLLWGISVWFLWFGWLTAGWLNFHHEILLWIAFGPCLFACGLFFSALCRSPILAWTGGVALTFACFFVIRLLVDMQINPFLMLIPSFGLTAWSFWIVSGRIYDRKQKRTWLKGSILLTACLLTFFALAIRQRVESVPLRTIYPHYLTDYQQAWKSPESLKLWEELESLARKDFDTKPFSVDELPEWYEKTASASPGENQENDGQSKKNKDPIQPQRSPDGFTIPILDGAALEKVLRIANAPKEPDWSQMVGWNRWGSNIPREKEFLPGKLTRLRYLLFNTAEYYSRLGKPEKSLDCLLAAIRLSPPEAKLDIAATVYAFLPRWSTGPGVTNEVVQKAIRRVEKIDSPVQDLLRQIIAIHLLSQQTLEDIDLVEKRVGKTDRRFFTLMPWERARVARIANYSAWDSIDILSREHERTMYQFSVGNSYFDRWGPGEMHERMLKRNRQTEGPLRFLTYSFRVVSYWGDHWWNKPWQTELFRRLALTSLAIRSYQLEHDGVLPGSLEDVADRLKNPHLTMSMPFGPPFSFRREGFTERQAVQPTLKTNYDPRIDRPALVHNLAGTPCIVLDKEVLYTAYVNLWYGLFDKINTSGHSFSRMPSVYPLPFHDKKQEAKEAKK